MRRQQLNPREGTETDQAKQSVSEFARECRQQLNPREGTETNCIYHDRAFLRRGRQQLNPREGTETEVNVTDQATALVASTAAQSPRGDGNEEVRV